MPNTFDWIEIRTNDIEEIARFYEGVFGWRVTEQETADGSEPWRAGLGIIQSPLDGHPSVKFAVVLAVVDSTVSD